MKNKILIYGIILAVFLFAIKSGKTQLPDIDEELRKKFNFDIIPGNQNNYRSAQLTPDELKKVIKKYRIKNIVRMNGDGLDGKHNRGSASVDRSQEEKICKDLGVQYYFFNSHNGYQAGKGYTKSIKNTSDILSKGNTLIHCAHGADRTGGMVGAYLKNSGIITDLDQLWAYTTKYNGWNRMIKNRRFFGSGYDKYADCFYPINLLKNSKWVK